jgi:hypothetical protein
MCPGHKKMSRIVCLVCAKGLHGIHPISYLRYSNDISQVCMTALPVVARGLLSRLDKTKKIALPCLQALASHCTCLYKSFSFAHASFQGVISPLLIIHTARKTICVSACVLPLCIVDPVRLLKGCMRNAERELECIHTKRVCQIHLPKKFAKFLRNTL